MHAALSIVLKAEALRATRTLNPRPERVTDPLFQGANFFDARDMMQVKYETPSACGGWRASRCRSPQPP